jgi:hypothetical protein
MIDILEFDTGPLTVGEKRRLVLDGDGPFSVSTSCFVEKPKPKGFRPCPQCLTTIAQSRQPVMIAVSSSFWSGKAGNIQVQITDAVGEVLRLTLEVLPDVDSESGTSGAPMAAGRS